MHPWLSDITESRPIIIVCYRYIIVYYGILRYIMVYYGILWYIMVYYCILWYIMVYYSIFCVAPCCSI